MKKFLGLMNIMLFSLLLGGAAVFGAERYGIVIDPLQACGTAFVGQLMLQPLIGHVNLIGSLSVITMANLSGPNGTEENIGGTIGTVYWCHKSDIATFEKPESFATATNYGELATIAAAHTFVTGKKMFAIYVTEDTGNLKFTSQGGVDGMSLKGTLEIFYPGAGADVLGFSRYIKNIQGIFWVPLPDGVIMQLGSEEFPAHVEVEFDTQKNSSGVRGTKITVSSAVSLSPTIYDAALQLTNAL